MVFDYWHNLTRHYYFKYFGSTISKDKNVAALRSKILKIEQTRFDDLTSCNIEWLNYNKRLRDLILKENPCFFLNWDIIQSTMFCEPLFVEFDYLKKSDCWGKIRKGLKESPVGNPRPYRYYPDSSGNLVHHMYTLVNFLEFHHLNFSEITGNVFEFGGGYGSFCRMFYNLGFSGKYTIYDQPEFVALQEFYLKSIFEDPRSISYISYFGDLDRYFTHENKLDIFIALWSLSECPIRFRSEILAKKCNPKYFLFAYQNKFGEIDNNKYFDDLILQNKRYRWVKKPIKHIPGNNYLYGVRIDPHGNK